MKIKVAFGPPTPQKISQSDTEAWRAFNGAFRTTEVTAEGFLKLVMEQRPYTAVHNRYRNAEEFVSCQHIGLDFDGKGGSASMESVAQVPFVSQFGSFVYTTPSHTETDPRCRVVFILDRPIRSAEKYVLLVRSILHNLNTVDGKCRDAARFFYGSGQNGRAAHINKILPLDACVPLVKDFQDFQERKEAERLAYLKSLPIISRTDVSPKLLAYKRDQLARLVENAVDGEKHDTLLRVSRTFGGYVASGYYDWHTAYLTLREAIGRNPNNVKDMKAAEKTIEWGLKHGASAPLYFVNRATSGYDELNLEKELRQFEEQYSEGQINHVKRLIDEVSWAAYHSAMEDMHYSLWSGMGINREIANKLQLGFRTQVVDEDGVILRSAALTIPHMVDGVTYNVEYRTLAGDVEYESSTPSAFFIPGQGTTVVMSDSMDAISFHQLYGEKYAVGAVYAPDDQRPYLPPGELVFVANPGCFNDMKQWVKSYGVEAKVATFPLSWNEIAKRRPSMDVIDGLISQGI